MTRWVLCLHQTGPVQIAIVQMLVKRMREQMPSLVVEVQSLLDPLHAMLLPFAVKPTDDAPQLSVDNPMLLTYQCSFSPNGVVSRGSNVPAMPNERQYATQLTGLHEAVTVGFRESLLAELFLRKAASEVHIESRIVFVTDFRRTAELQLVKAALPTFVHTLLIDGPPHQHVATESLTTSLLQSTLQEMAPSVRKKLCEVYSGGAADKKSVDDVFEKLSGLLLESHEATAAVLTNIMNAARDKK